jgi:hypothetical protein
MIAVYNVIICIQNNTINYCVREHNQPVTKPVKIFINFSFIQNITKNLPLFSMN